MAPNKKQQSGKKEVDPLSVVWDRLSLSTISKADFEQLTEVEQRLEFDLGVSIEHIALADLKLLKSHFGNRKLSQEIWDHLFGHCEMQSVERVRQFLVLIAQLIAEPGEVPPRALVTLIGRLFLTARVVRARGNLEGFDLYQLLLPRVFSARVFR